MLEYGLCVLNPGCMVVLRRVPAPPQGPCWSLKVTASHALLLLHSRLIIHATDNHGTRATSNTCMADGSLFQRGSLLPCLCS